MLHSQLHKPQALPQIHHLLACVHYVAQHTDMMQIPSMHQAMAYAVTSTALSRIADLLLSAMGWTFNSLGLGYTCKLLL